MQPWGKVPESCPADTSTPNHAKQMENSWRQDQETHLENLVGSTELEFSFRWMCWGRSPQARCYFLPFEEPFRQREFWRWEPRVASTSQHCVAHHLAGLPWHSIRLSSIGRPLYYDPLFPFSQGICTLAWAMSRIRSMPTPFKRNPYTSHELCVGPMNWFVSTYNGKPMAL